MKITILPLLSFLIILALLVFTTGCKKEELGPYVPFGYRLVEFDYNSHYPKRQQFGGFVNEDRFHSFAIMLDSSMLNQKHTTLDSLDWIKWEGIVYKNGNKFQGAWRYISKQFQVSLYLHKNGNILHSEKHIVIPFDVKNPYRIEVGLDANDSTFITVQGTYFAPVTYKREPLKSTKIGRYTFDHAGGTKTMECKYYKMSNL